MDICSNGHTEVCYDVRSCPMCDLKKELEEKDKESKVLTEELEKVKEENEELKEQIDINVLRKSW